MVTAGADSRVRVWDLRTYRAVHSYFSEAPASHLDLSQRGHLAVGFGSRVQVWADALGQKQAAPYLTHRLPPPSSAVTGLRFCPYEDVLGVGTSSGYASWLIPGSGEPNYDSLVADPYQTGKQRREAEVRALLDKLPPEMIVLDPGGIGGVRPLPAEAAAERREEAREANASGAAAQRARNAAKTRMKGKNAASKRHRKKRLNIVEEKRAERDEGLMAAAAGAQAAGAGTQTRNSAAAGKKKAAGAQPGGAAKGAKGVGLGVGLGLGGGAAWVCV